METKWAVVGLGIHAVERMLPAVRRTRHTRLAGVYSRRPEVTQEIARTYGVRGYRTFDEALDDPDVQVVYLATPNDVHLEQTVRAAAARKHVLVEKPMALSPEDAVAMVRACAGAGVRLYVGFHLRFHPAHQQARALVAAGEIGDVVWAGARWVSQRPPDVGWRLDPARSGGTLLTARGVHLLDLIRFVCATEFLTVSGASDGFRADHPADDTTAGMGTLASGTLAHILCSRLVPHEGNDLEVYGTSGTVVCRSTIAAEPAGTLVLTRGAMKRAYSYDRCDVLAGEFDWVSTAVVDARGDELGASGEDGVRVTAVTTGLIESVQSGRTVRLHYPL
ncbi:MAG TPA: Gfo/Idh/MocA family oxidoreductase [bacterium]|nr:Gfo/Idh/MocA family oxidoreductase [bacterium]